MENMIRIQSLRIAPNATFEEIQSLTENIVRKKPAELLLVPDHTNGRVFLGIVPTDYYTDALRQCLPVLEVVHQEGCTVMTITATGIRTYVHQMMRKLMNPAVSKPAMVVEEVSVPKESASFDELLKLARQDDGFPQFFEEEQPEKAPEKVLSPVEKFLQENAPAQIEAELNKRVIGQPQLVKGVADFLYYHALRQVHPQLPQRPLLISGPSGSGKTEVWRVASKLYGHIFPIQIIDGSALTCDGWAGSQKLSTFITPQMADGGIVVVDEFDKLTVPRISSSGNNVSREMQSEFLKLIEGEFHIIQNRKDTGLTSQAMGFVMVGAFESMRGQKTAPAPKVVGPIGFCPLPQQEAATQVPAAAVELTDEDFIRYGIMPEIVGRIASKCATAPLSQEACLGIIRGPYSRVAVLADVLKGYGVEESELISDEEILSLLRTARSNQTGFRWVSAQVENRMLERIRQGVHTLDKAS